MMIDTRKLIRALLVGMSFSAMLGMVGYVGEPVSAIAHEEVKKPNNPPKPAKKDAAKGKTGAKEDSDSAIEEIDPAVPDTYDPAGGKIAKSLRDLYKDYKDNTDDDFSDARKDIHKNHRPAEDTKGYQRLRDLQARLKKKAEDLEAQYKDGLERASKSNPHLKKALDHIKPTKAHPRRDQESTAIDSGLKGGLGKLMPGQIKELRKLRHILGWVDRIEKARMALDDALKLLEADGAIYRRVGQVPRYHENYALAFAYSVPELCVATTYYVGKTVPDGTGAPQYLFGQPVSTTAIPVSIAPTEDGFIPDCPGAPQPSTPVASTPRKTPTEVTTPEDSKLPSTTKVMDKPKPQESDQPDLGLVKAQEAVVMLALSGKDTGKAVSQASIKLLGDAPEVPLADAKRDPALTSSDNYAADAAGGKVNKDGEIAVALADNNGDATNPLVIEVSDKSPAPNDRTKRTVRQKVNVPQERFAQLVVTAKTKVSAEESFSGLSAKLAANTTKTCIARAFRIGATPVYVVRLPQDQVAQFETAVRKDADHSVEPDPCRQKEGDNDPYYQSKGLWGQKFDDQWAIKRVGFDSARMDDWPPDPAKLKPVTVAIIDSGLDWYHPDLLPSALWHNPGEIPGNGIDDDHNGYVDDVIGWNFIQGNNRPWDYDGHGTFVAGLIAAGQNNHRGIAGLNPAARIMVLQALDPFGRGHASMVAEALAYAADNGARVINLSLGGAGLTRIEQQAVNYAHSKGAVVVVAAGNDGKEVSGYSPAGLDGVITVAATDRRDHRAGFSNWGSHIDIAAPGVDVLSLRARKTDLLFLIRGVKYEKGKGIVGKDRAYYRASGTSFSAPLVTATLSLILSRNPALTGDQARRMVLNSARDIDIPGMDNYTGYGLLDAAAALKALPDYFIDSRISGVKVVKKNGKAMLRIIGTTDADQFATAQIMIGQGNAPTKWLKLRKEISTPRHNEVLMDLPAVLLRGAKQWTLRLITIHKDGSRREARFEVKLG